MCIHNNRDMYITNKFCKCNDKMCKYITTESLHVATEIQIQIILYDNDKHDGCQSAGDSVQ